MTPRTPSIGAWTPSFPRRSLRPASVRRLRALAVGGLLLAAACTGETATPIDLDDVESEGASLQGEVDSTGEATDRVTGPDAGDAVPPELDDEEVDTDGDGEISPEEQNAASSRMARRYAEQQCLDDPELDTGVIEIVHQETEEVVARIEADCDEVRAREVDGGSE